ncbi:MAG: hypothetical protein IPK22_24000 [Verrucomicrobiaceae bacterium]|nr:hypothetical protein [Verrucomicrobiaceae bacterium]
MRNWLHRFSQALIALVLLCAATYAVWYLYWTDRTTVKIEAFSGSSGVIKWRGADYEVETPDGREALQIAIQSRISFPPEKFSTIECILTVDPNVTADIIEHVFLVTANVGIEQLAVIDRLSGTRAVLFAQGGKLLDEYDPVFASDAPSVSTFAKTTWKSPVASEHFLWAAIARDTLYALDQRDVDFATFDWQAKLKDSRLILLVDRGSRAGQLVRAVASAQKIKPIGPLVLWIPLR